MKPSILFALIAVLPAVLAGCAEPQIVQATDCRGAAVPCGIVVVEHTDAMSSAQVPVSGLPGLP